ncbi:uncharacterized protein LOC111103772 [Crassostrea virginica]
MGTVMEVWIFALSTFAFLSPIIFHESVGFILTITQDGQSLNTSGPSLTPIGQKQCMKECLRRGDCLSVNYWRNQLRCQLNPAVVGPGLALIPDSSGVYMEKSSQPQDLLPGSCASSACTHKCTELSSGMTACMPVFREATETSPSPTTTTTVPTIITTTTTAPPTTTSSSTTTSATTTTTTSPPTTTSATTTTTTAPPPTTSSSTTTSATTTTTTSPPTTTSATTTTTTAPPPTTSSSTTTSATTTTTTSPPTTTSATTTTTTSPPTTTSSSTTTSATTTTTTTAPPTTTSSSTTTSATTTTTAPATTTSSSTTTSATTTTTAPATTTSSSTTTSATTTTTTTAPPTTTSSSTTTSATTTTTTTLPPTTSSTTTTTATSPTTTTTLSLQTTTTGTVLSCPPTFVWNPVVSLCYKVHESPLMWPDAKVHCESLGARLAVLDTAAKLDVLTSDYSAGFLMNYQYFIGGSFNDIITDWTWVDGLIIDPIFLMTYLISGGSGFCLAWDDATVLNQLSCSLSKPFVCEIPSAAMPPTVSSPSTMAPPLTSSPVPVLSPVCPDSFVYNPSLNFCYRVDETAFVWQDAKTHCESFGARLAILDTPDKLNAIFSDYTMGLLMSLHYFIGGQYDDLVLDYKWVDNTLVDSGFLMNYPVSRIAGQCLLWNNLDMLRSQPCHYSLPVICEVPMVTSTPTEAPFSCPSTYIWKPAVSLCYKNIEDTHKWSEGDVTCTAAGGRLAILNTDEKLLSVMDDYDLGGVLFSNAYHIGGQFVGGVGWQWVDGTPVDPSLLNSYSILGVDGDCLFWDSLYLLIQDKCDTSERILCEQVPPVI